jgi:hypothetical protein
MQLSRKRIWLRLGVEVFGFAVRWNKLPLDGKSPRHFC